ncbi:PPE family protein [Mycobacterium spongiae]|uniref:PPE domain-containing protein n=1 Tax=Mycobacterium spongiae TaxID=886343 RepID=A0A975PVI3_9MYCO|nr:PPE family protein [Mycobacterium spongiae]QUR66145.1 PPE domain-containing protein [Mycobacterium spongiae]
MDFGARPPEVNSAEMYAGPGSGSMLIAAAAWEVTAEELYSAASASHAIISTLTDHAWLSQAAVAMAAASAPYVAWIGATAVRAELTASQMRAAAGAYDTAFAATVPPPVVAANRTWLMFLTATNVLGVNAAAIAAAEAHYLEMWAQDAAAMYGYAAASATASTLTSFTGPDQVVDVTGVAEQSVAVAQAGAVSGATRASATLPDVASAVPQALQQLAQPLQLGTSSIASSGTNGWSLQDALEQLTMVAAPTSSGASTMSSSMSAMSSMSSVVKTLGASGAIAAPLEGDAATALGSALSGELARVGGWSAEQLPGLSAPESAVSAEVGKAVSLGPLSVPQSWASAAGASGPLVGQVSSAGIGAGSPGEIGGPGNMFGGLPFAGMAPRGEGGLSVATMRPGGVRHAVMPRPEFVG